MAEISSPEDCELVAQVYESAMTALHGGEEISKARRRVHDVEHMMQEVNSGASFEQYLRWASIEELQNIEAHLAALGLHEAARLLRAAFEIAFPRGLPASEDEKSEATEWTSEQEDQLASLFGPFESENGAITNALAAYARTNQL